jgi:metallo-beta-lactamase family protein
MELEFLGGAGTVTGSKTLVRAGDSLVLVDCGLFQGLRHLRRRNWEPMFLEPRSLDAIVLTHAHLDHSGAVPNFVRRGFRGPVYATPGTIALCEVLWPDSGRLQEEDAEYAARRGYSKHRPPRALYTEAEAIAALDHLVAVDEGEVRELGAGLTMEYAPVGHILGAAAVRITGDDTSVLFSGDVGRPDDLVMPPPSTAISADTLVLESTYGDRRHPEIDPVDAIGEIVRSTVARGGTVLVPAFAVGRSQSVLVALARLREQGAIPDVPVFLDSPMAIAATRAYLHRPNDHRLAPDEVYALEKVAQHLVSVEESKALNRRIDPCVIVSAAGMLSGGRVLHHFERLAPNPRNTVVLVGYQAPGTRGSLLLAGERRIKMHGAYVPVRCRVEHLDMLSAHADQQELLDWLGALDPMPQGVLLNHGESEASEALRRRIDDELSLPCDVATDGMRVTLVPIPQPRKRAPVPEVSDDVWARLAQILHSRRTRTDLDLDLLATDDLRATRLMLEFLRSTSRCGEASRPWSRCSAGPGSRPHDGAPSPSPR